MSASDKKKVRKEQAAAALTERQRQEQAEAKKLKIYSITFVAGLILVAVIAATVLGIRAYTQSGIAEKNTIVANIGDRKLNSIEFSYYYNDVISEFYNTWYEQYSTYTDTYLQAVGLDVTKPLNAQTYDNETGESWADFFVGEALDRAKSDYALNDLAAKEDFQLSEDEKTSLENMATNLNTYATIYGYSNANQYLRTMYGNGATAKTYKEYSERRSIADAYKLAHQESLEYDDAAIREYEKDKIDNYNSYSYSYAYMSYNDFRHGGTEDENGNVTYTDAENEAAREAVKFAAEKLATSTSLEEMKEMLHLFENDEVEETEEAPESEEATESEEVAEEAETPESEEVITEDTSDIVKINASSQLAINDFTNSLHTEINAPLATWLAAEERQEGDIAAIENTSTTTAEDGTETTVINGYYVVYFKSKTENKTPLSNVRHLLVSFEGGTEDEETGEIVYSEEEKATAKELADGYLKTWQDGEATEESFIALVKEHTDDTGSAETGGLYEDIHPKSEYVANFLSWSIDASRKEKDVAVVETEYGYHVMYFVGHSDITYRDYMITNEMRSADQETWYNGVMDSVATELKDTSLLKLDMIISPAS